MSDAAASTDPSDPVLNMLPEGLVLWPSGWFGPDRAQASDQSGDPVRRLKRLIAMALDMEGRLDQATAPFVFLAYMLCAARAISAGR